MACDTGLATWKQSWEVVAARLTKVRPPHGPTPQDVELAGDGTLKATKETADSLVLVAGGRRNAAAAAQRQLAAEKIIFDDPFVQSMMRDFGAKIVPGSIKPIDSA